LINSQRILLALVGIFALGIGGQWLAWRIRVPSILLLLTLGILVGPVFNLLQPDELFGDLLLPAVSLAVGVILFEGGLSLRLRELTVIGRPLVGLLTVGVFVTWTLCTLFGIWLLDLDPSTALLLGAILVVTGPTVVGPLLQHIRPLGKVGPIARWEGIVIDPIGAVLAVLVFEAAAAMREAAYGAATMTAIWGLGQTVLIGVGLGIVSSFLLIQLLRRHWIPDHLQNPGTLLAVLAAFALSNLMQHESGLVTVTLMGVILANQNKVTIKHIVEFKENLSVMLISSLFIVLTARLRLEYFAALGWRGPAFVAAVILLIRPLSVWLATWGTALTRNDRLFLAWLAPRGVVAAAVASVFALELGSDGDGLVAATFLVITGTVVVYGLTAGRLALWLGLSEREPQGVLIASAHAGARAVAHALKKAGFKTRLVDLNRHNIRTAQMEGLPTLYANVLSDSTMDELDLGGIGRLLAMTPNDEVNTLACDHFSELFGRAQVYRLAPQSGSSQRKETSNELISGRTLFASKITYRAIDERFERGAVVKTTRMTGQFDYSAFVKQYGASALLLFVVDETGRLQIATTDRKLTPRPGQRVIALVDPTRTDLVEPATPA
jgi:NhaP-type Na+/H+ or K+/H+ antiporter